MGSTQVIWKQLIGALKGQYEVITFDFRCHGNASSSIDHSFNAFLSDANCLMEAVGADRPIVVAWSFGADLALNYVASHPGVVAGLIIIDGAVPIAAPLVEDEKKMRRLLNSVSMKFSQSLMLLTPYKYRLSGNAIADVAMDLDVRRQQLFDMYARITCPITMVLATKTAGAEKTEHAKRNNRLWRDGGNRLAAVYPSIQITWLDAGHRLPLTKPVELAKAIDDFARSMLPN